MVETGVGLRKKQAVLIIAWHNGYTQTHTGWDSFGVIWWCSVDGVNI